MSRAHTICYFSLHDTLAMCQPTVPQSSVLDRDLALLTQSDIQILNHSKAQALTSAFSFIGVHGFKRLYGEKMLYYMMCGQLGAHPTTPQPVDRPPIFLLNVVHYSQSVRPMFEVRPPTPPPHPVCHLCPLGLTETEWIK